MAQQPALGGTPGARCSSQDGWEYVPMKIYEYAFTRRRIAESPATVRSPSDTLPILRDLIGDRETERLAVLWLDTKHHVIGSDPASCPRSVLALECESPERESARGAASARMAA